MLGTFQHKTAIAVRLILVVSPINMSKNNIRLPPALLVHWCRRKAGESGENGLQREGSINVDFIITISHISHNNEFVERKEIIVYETN